MQAIDETGGGTAAVHYAAVKSGIDVNTIGALAQIVADLEIGYQHGVSLFQDGERVADVIVVAMRDQHMRDTPGGFLPPLFQGGLSDRNGSIRILAAPNSMP
ncbi:hypothetical protein J2Z50_006632 [Ensifer mexicanus]|nr:hypothetical protein [Sinorhizobium mexicanum]